MTNIDKKDIENIEKLQKILKSKKLGSIKIKKGQYEIKVSTKFYSSKESSKDYKNKPELKISETSKSKPILAQIPRYIYLVAIFSLLSGIFFPLITTGADDAYSFVIGGAAVLFLGLAGGILVFKATTSDKRRGIFLAIGFAFIAISLALIFLIQEWWKLEFIRS